MWSVALCMLLFSLTKAQRDVVTNGTSGQPCPHHRCLDGLADCVNGDTCVCRPPLQQDPNNGNKGCYGSDSLFGEVFNDPKVTNFNKETANFPFSCRYMLTSIATDLKIPFDDRSGNCRCQLHAFHHKYRGKFYVGGFDFGCFIIEYLDFEYTQFTIRIVGIARNGVYTYTEDLRDDYYDYYADDPWVPIRPLDAANFTWTGINIGPRYDTINNQAIMEIPECGWRITFVAYDVETRLQQKQIPGISFAVDTSHNPNFFEHDRHIATAPTGLGGTTYADLAQPPFSITEVLIHRAFTSKVPQHHPGAAPQCLTIGNILGNCSQPNLNKTAKGCFWITEKPKFVRCLDPGNDTVPVMDIYEKCTGVHCAGTPTCNHFINNVQATGCSTVQGIPELTNINNGNFCT